MQEKKEEYFFEDIPVIGNLPPKKLAKKLENMGDIEAAKAIRAKPKRYGLGWGSKEVPAWKHTAHAFGYIPLIEPGENDQVEITHAGHFKVDETKPSLKNQRIKISLGYLRVADYPGKGIHHVLFDFYAKNQLPKQVEHLHFNQVFRAQQGESIGVVNYPIFVGLSVGSEGIDFKCCTVNVKNDDDQKILNFLDSDVVKSGLKLAKTAQPAIAPLTELAIGITKMFARRNENVRVQDFVMGLDFTNVAFGAYLAEGSYVAVQIPQKSRARWKWDQWVYNPLNGLIVNKNDNDQLIPYNYLVFNVSKYDEA